MDPEHLDEMERRGDSLLDEQRWWMGVQRSVSEVSITQFGDVSIGFSGQFDGDAPAVNVWLKHWEASRLANAILSELEIAGRTEAGEFDE